MTAAKRTTAKSERTRRAIERAAKELFAVEGFERTTVRAIARAASIDAAMIIRYYGSKEALFAKVAEPDLRLPDLTALGRDAIGLTLVRHFLDLWEGGAEESGLPILLRSAASNAASAAQLRDIFAGQVVPAITELGDPQTAAQRAGLVSSQLLGLALTRYLLQLPAVAAMPRDVIEREIGATIQRYATGS